MKELYAENYKMLLRATKDATEWRVYILFVDQKAQHFGVNSFQIDQTTFKTSGRFL